MPSSPFSSLPNNHYFLSQIQKCIPRKWKQNQTVPDQPMIHSLFVSLKNFASQGQLHNALQIFTSIQACVTCGESFNIFVISLSRLLLCCCNLKSLTYGKHVHSYIVASGLECHSILVPSLVTFYTSFGMFDNASYIVCRSGIRHPSPWNLLISGFVRNGFSREAISMYRVMVEKGVRPDDYTYPSVLKACSEELDIVSGREVHKSIECSGIEWNLYVCNALIYMYGKCGEVDVARKLFDEMPQRDAVSWNSMISCYASGGMWKEAFEVFDHMQGESMELNMITWNTIAGGCLKTGRYDRALELVCQMRKCLVHLDPVAVITGLGACSHVGSLKLGKEIHGLAVRSYCFECDKVKNSLITMYSRCNDLRLATVMFNLVQKKCMITWNSIISGYSQWDQTEEAFFLFREMILSGFEPNNVTIASLLPLCARVANLQHGREFHCYMVKREWFKDYLLLWNALVDMYARSGKISLAKRLFDLLSKKDEVTYTSLIAGYGIQGEGKAALKLFKEMNASLIRPDHVTMIAVLSACSHSGLLIEGQMLFEKMSRVYGITPRLEHFACMVDLYGRAGLIQKAVKILKNMKYKPTQAMWATLIGACRKHRNTEVGEWAAKNLLEMKPQNSGYYVLIANMYAAAGCWNELAKVRTSMRDWGVKKAPGCAWIDAGAGISPFVVGDTSNTQSEEINTLLRGLLKQMKEAGYVACEDSYREYEVIEEQIEYNISS